MIVADISPKFVEYISYEPKLWLIVLFIFKYYFFQDIDVLLKNKHQAL